MRVATWNVLHGVDLRHCAVDIAAVADAVAALDADVVALQEVDRGLARSGGEDQAAEIARRLGWSSVFAPSLVGDPDVAWRAVQRGDAGAAGYGIALLSRMPVRDVGRLALPGGGDGSRRRRRPPATNPGWDRVPRVAVRASLDVAGRTITVVATHLSYLPWRGLRQLRRLDRALDSGDPTVLLGDLNLPPRATALVTPGWTNAGGSPTYPAGDPRMQLDQVLVRGLEVAAVRVGEAATSDHRPLIADLRLP